MTSALHRLSVFARRGPAAAALAAALLLWGCGEKAQVGVLTCPQVYVVNDASTLIEYAEGSGRDIIDEMVLARIVNVEWLCTFVTDENRVDMEVRFGMTARLGQAAVNAGVNQMRFPYFVVVADPSGKIVAKQVFGIDTFFPGNMREIAHVESVLQRLGYANIAQAAKFTVYIGFQLTRAQLAESRKVLIP